MVGLKGSTMYGYVQSWEGYPFYMGPNIPSIPTEVNSFVVNGAQTSGDPTLNIKDAVGSFGAGDTAILANYAYLILDRTGNVLTLEPALTEDLADGVIGSVILSQRPVTSFKIAEVAEVPLVFSAHLDGEHLQNATLLSLRDIVNEPIPGQYLTIGMYSYLIEAWNSPIVTIDTGLEYTLPDNALVTQTSYQEIKIKDLEGDLFVDDTLIIGDHRYSIKAYDAGPPETITLFSGVLEEVAVDTVCYIYRG